jgi:hypothetical protein
MRYSCSRGTPRTERLSGRANCSSNSSRDRRAVWSVCGGQPQCNASVLKRLKLPVPPLDEQRRIVAILDQFDARGNDLAIGLPAELRARRQQYEYYRDRLRTFREAA